ncbi:MAG: hypothetical protein HW400_373 [Candidatus Levybacteria bacterium]|nr:hypothetical protein [Candidatus Levybacteria bacterium]
MGKERLTIYQAQEKRIAYIQDAVAEGVLDKISKKISGRNQNIAIVYSLSEEITGENIGKFFPKLSGEDLTSERVRQISRRFLAEAWKYSSPQLQNKHPLRELYARRPSALNQINARIKELILKGTNLTDIESAEGKTVLENARDILGKRGIKIPAGISRYEDFKVKAEMETDDRKLQKLLDDCTSGQLIGYLGRHNNDEQIVLTGLSGILRKNGFHPHNFLKLFMGKIRADGIPCGEINHTNDKSKYPQVYRVVFVKHEERILNAIKDDHDLKKFKGNLVESICGKSEITPTTTDFIKYSNKYSFNLAGVIREALGLAIGGRSRLKISDFLDGCPVPLFKYANRYAWEKDRTEELKAFLKSRWGKIRQSMFPRQGS